MPRHIGRLSASVPLSRDRHSTAFITDIAESSFRYTQDLPAGGPYSDTIPAAFAAVFQVSTSSTMSAAKSCDEPPLGSTPTFIKPFFISVVARAALISLLSRLTMSAGVPAGANSPVQK